MVQLDHPQLGRIEATDLDFESPDEQWRTYELADGTSLKVKTVINKVFRVEGQYNQLGEPMYQIGTENLVRTANVSEDVRIDTTETTNTAEATEAGGEPSETDEEDS